MEPLIVPKVDEKIESGHEFYERFIKESPLREGDHGLPSDQVDKSNSSDLNDPELIAQGIEFTRRNYFSVLIGHLVMFIVSLASRYGRVVILHTGESLTKEKARRRDLATVVRLMRWLEGDMVSGENNNIVSKDLHIVRKIHQLAAKNHSKRPKPELPPLNELQTQVLEAIRKETEHVDMSVAPEWVLRDDPEIPFSQLVQSIGQAGFMGTLVYMPETFGVTDLTGADGYVHQYAIIGRHLGLEDRFSWALHHKKNPDGSAFRELREKLMLPTLKTIDEAGVILWQAFIDGITDYFFILRFLPAVKFTLNCAGLEGSNIDPLMDWKDRFCYWLLNWGLYSLGPYRVGKRILNLVQ